ncbi:MAG: HAD hydrolase-like protein [Patescibacteria group bacterium]
MKEHFILFDFDGVIADSFNLAFEIQKMICPHLDEDAYRKRFDRNINDCKEPIHHTEQCRHDINFFAEYVPRMKNEVRIIPGIKEIIIELEKNYKLIIISSTITSPVRDFLLDHGLDRHFTEIMGNDVHESKVEKIKMVFEKFSAKPNDYIFITDTLGDMREASHFSIDSIGVSWGFQEREALLKGKPFRLVDKPSELLTAVSDYFKI